jgi:glycosyltransferase involved in cell wall biosynthesis
MATIPRLSQVDLDGRNGPRTGPATTATSLVNTGGVKYPRVSILLGARDEAEKLPAALHSLLSQDYPDFEVIAVDDRSRDRTGAIMDELAASNPRLTVVHVNELPSEWLGKPHALQTAFELSTGEWLVFTDADVRFAADLLKRSMTLTEQNEWDHLTLLTALELHGFWETATIAYLGLGFAIGMEPWRVSDPKSDKFFGVGAFQLVRRAAYEKVGMHEKLAMEVVDDIKLGKLIKMDGFRSGVAVSEEYVKLRWQDGFLNLIHGLTKNLFAGFGFKVRDVILPILAIFLLSIFPSLALFFMKGPALLACAAAVIAPAVVQGVLVRETYKPAWYGLAHPLGAVIFIYMVMRSMCFTLWRGGIVWRDTFYPLAELRKGQV